MSSGHSGWFWGSPQPQGNSLTDLEFAGSRGYAVGGFGTILRTDNGGDTWVGLRSGVTTPLNEVTMVGSDTVIVAGGCVLRRSDNGGATFSRLPWTASDLSCLAPIASIAFP